MGGDAAQEKTRQRLVVATVVGVGCPDGFVIGADALANDGERVVGRMMGKIPKANHEMGMMSPARLGKTARLELVDEGLNVLCGGQHNQSLGDTGSDADHLNSPMSSPQITAESSGDGAGPLFAGTSGCSLCCPHFENDICHVRNTVRESDRDRFRGQVGERERACHVALLKRCVIPHEIKPA